MRIVRNDLVHLQADLARAAIGMEKAVLRPVATYASTRIAGRAVGTFMRDAKGEPKRRSAGDSGPLRIVTGRAARSLTGGGGSPDAVQEVAVNGARLTLTKGSRAPGIVYNEERISRGGSRLATLRPATNQELPAIGQYAERKLQAHVREVLR